MPVNYIRYFADWGLGFDFKKPKKILPRTRLEPAVLGFEARAYNRSATVPCFYKIRNLGCLLLVSQLH